MSQTVKCIGKLRCVLQSCSSTHNIVTRELPSDQVRDRDLCCRHVHQGREAQEGGLRQDPASQRRTSTSGPRYFARVSRCQPEPPSIPRICDATKRSLSTESDDEHSPLMPVLYHTSKRQATFKSLSRYLFKNSVIVLYFSISLSFDKGSYRNIDSRV